MWRTDVSYRCLIWMLMPAMWLACMDDSSVRADKAQSRAAYSASRKPGSSFSDTVMVDHAAAVLFQPDSVQLQKIRAANEPAVFESMSHELEFQLRNARLEMKRNWPRLNIMDVANARYLLFIGKNGRKQLVDLDQKNDMSGIILFEPAQDPVLIDMMNIDTELERYFKQSHNR